MTNPKTWPQGLRLFVGAFLLTGIVVLPYLAKDGSLSPSAHATIAALAGLWLLLVNTWNGATGDKIPTDLSSKAAAPAALYTDTEVDEDEAGDQEVTKGGAKVPTPPPVSVEIPIPKEGVKIPRPDKKD